MFFYVLAYCILLIRWLRQSALSSRYRMVVGLTNTYAISAYQHWCCEFKSRSSEVYSIQHYMIKFVSDLRQVGGFLRGLRFPPPIKLTSTICWLPQYNWTIVQSGLNTIRRVWRYQRGNQNPYIEEQQTTQWPKEKVQKGKRSKKHSYKARDRVTRTPLKTGGELRCSGRVSSSCSTSGTRRVNLVNPNPMSSIELILERLFFFTCTGTYTYII
jgi:hypothetical protein